MSETLRRWWTERVWREQATIFVASVAFVLGLAYAYLWQPVSRERDRLLVRLPELRAEAQAMERDARELDRLIQLSHNAVNLRAAVENAADVVSPAPLVQIVAESPSQLRAIIATTTQEHAFRWVARLQATRGVRLESARFTALADGDHVKVEALVGGVQ